MTDYDNVITRDDVAASLEPVAGRTVIHNLTEAEIDAYVSLIQAEEDFDYAREIIFDGMQSDIAKSVSDSLKAGFGLNFAMPMKISPEDADNLLMTQHRWVERKAVFWGQIRRGRNEWNSYLAVAAGWVIVKLGVKIQTINE